MRQMQISSTEFFVYVEGSNTDGYVHGNNCDIALTPMKVRFEVVPAGQLPGGGGGKTRLKEFFEELQRSGSLVSTFQGKTTVVAFFMDKDIDDAIGTLISSDHILYTDFYDVENHVFSEGDVARAVASACSLSPNWCRDTFGEAGLWQANAARNWVDWVKLCYSSKTSNAATEANYGRLSPVNNPLYAVADSNTLAKLERKLHKSIREKSKGSCHEWVNSREEVDRLYKSGNWDVVFKGKWYAHILAAEIVARSPYSFDTKHLAPTLVKQVAATMHFSSPWANKVRAAITQLAAVNGLPNSS